MIILNLLLRYYKDMFARIWIFSPSIKLDPQYAPLRKYLEKMSDQDKEPLMFEDLNQAVLGKILDEQRIITEECRKRKMKAPQVCVVLDDLADRGDILTKRQGGNQGSWLISLAPEAGTLLSRGSFRVRSSILWERFFARTCAACASGG